MAAQLQLGRHAFFEEGGIVPLLGRRAACGGGGKVQFIRARLDFF